jgi:hypothetical protein
MKVINNALLEGVSGRISDVVFRQRFGKTIISKMPDYSNPPPSSARQISIRLQFKDAVAYAKTVMADPVLKMLYGKKAKNGRSAFNLAIADFCKPPVIDNIDTGNYHGRPGSSIRIVATDDFRVMSVAVKIEKQGSLLEEGAAIPSGDGLHWLYNVTVTNGSVTGNNITVTAIDQPGHAVVKQKTV